MQQIAVEPNVVMRHPCSEIVEIDPDIDFTYIMRKDGDFTVRPIARRVAREQPMDESWCKQILAEEYDSFVAALIDCLGRAFSSKGRCEIHLYDPQQLEHVIRAKAGDDPILSLDPLLFQGVASLPVSRGYHLSGKKDFGQVTRPGHEPIDKAARAIAKAIRRQPACVVEDDIFSGSSLLASLEALVRRKVVIRKVIPGIQIGTPDRLTEMGIAVDPAVRYRTTDSSDIFARVDLGDPRDYLLGASGLVIQLPNGDFGRAPYILPFVSTTARAGVPAENERAFSIEVLCASLTFFRRVEERLKIEFRLRHLDDHFVTMMHDLYGIESSSRMERVIQWALDRFDHIWETTQALGEQAEREKQRPRSRRKSAAKAPTAEHTARSGQPRKRRTPSRSKAT